MKVSTLIGLFTAAGVVGGLLFGLTIHFYKTSSESASDRADAELLLWWCGNRKGNPVSADDLNSMDHNATIRKVNPHLYTYETEHGLASRRFLRGRIIFDSQDALVGCTVDQAVGWR